MKTVTFAILLVFAMSAAAGETKTDPRAFRMPRPAKPPAKPAAEAQRRKGSEAQSRRVSESQREESAPSAPEAAVAAESAPAASEAPVASAAPVILSREDGEGTPTQNPEVDPLAFTLPNHKTPTIEPEPKTDVPAAQKPASFALPNQTPAPAPKKKIPTRFRLPEKKKN